MAYASFHHDTVADGDCREMGKVNEIRPGADFCQFFGDMIRAISLKNIGAHDDQDCR
jgi:hypothetical protein